MNMSSTSGIRYSGHDYTAYAASKAAIIRFTRSIALQYAKNGIRCNSILLGLVHTPLVEARLAGHRTVREVQEFIEERNNAVPTERMEDGRDTANAALLLTSDEARPSIAKEIIVDGGRPTANSI